MPSTPTRPFNTRGGYSNLDAQSSPTLPRYNQQQQPGGQPQMYSNGGGYSRDGSPARRYDDVRGPPSASGSSMDERGPSAIASGQIGGGYGPYAYNGAGSTSSRPSRDASLPPNPSQSTLSSQQNRYTPRQSNGPSPFAARNQPPSSPSPSSNDSHNGRGAAGGGGATAATPLTGATRSAPVFTARDAELDDKLHNVGPHDDHVSCTVFSWRGILNMGAIILLVTVLVLLFAGWPIIQWAQSLQPDTFGAYGVGGINSSGQIPDIPGFRSLIDQDTPTSALTRTGFDGQKYVLAFSDEFETDGRTFWPGDDPYWEAVDIHYWATGDFEWYDPDAVTTKDGKLVITLTEEPTHGLNFRSDESSSSWNKFCFTNGYIEVSLQLPGSNDISGYWPGAWTMGNLGRAGHGATTDGVWPYSYNSCDIGTLPNQTNLAGTGPPAALNSGSKDYGGSLSYLPGQKLSACTCPGDADMHPGPDVTVGRGAPEIDIIEAQVSWTGKALVGSVSQSGQFAPYDEGYQYKNTSQYCEIYDTDQTMLNEYLGGVYQQAVSGVTYTNPKGYAESGGFSSYGWEANADSANGGKDGYITWQTDGKKAWTMHASAVGPNPATQVGQRLVSEEPMYIILNLGISESFQRINWAQLGFPAQMLVDYVRVYQREGELNLGCDTATHPTQNYIQKHLPAYLNPNYTTWDMAGFKKPKNSMQGC